MSPQQKKLQRLFSSLGEADRKTLLDFAEFLASREQEAEPVVMEPQPIPRPKHESVVAAMKRLSASYPMLDKAKVLNEASSLMAQHILQGREAAEVIDELESLFQKQFRMLQESGLPRP